MFSIKLKHSGNFGPNSNGKVRFCPFWRTGIFGATSGGGPLFLGFVYSICNRQIYTQLIQWLCSFVFSNKLRDSIRVMTGITQNLLFALSADYRKLFYSQSQKSKHRKKTMYLASYSNPIVQYLFVNSCTQPKTLKELLIELVFILATQQSNKTQLLIWFCTLGSCKK